jgi:hypothetical protein
MGGNGEYIAHAGYALEMASVQVLAGKGGDCEDLAFCKVSQVQDSRTIMLTTLPLP